MICAVDVNGNVSFHNLGLRSPEDVRLIPSPVKNLYAADFVASTIWKIAAANFTGFERDIVLVDEGVLGCVGTGLFLVHWDGARFVVRAIDLSGSVSRLEQVQFAP